jgi:cell wall-associated NlpC family hydrolase
VTEDEGRAAVVAEALSWLRTPYHPGARVKGVGVDCAQLVIGVYAGAGVIRAFEPETYPHDWHVHRDVERYLQGVMRFGGEITRDQVRPGDLALYKFGRVFSHGAIVVQWPQIIHAVLGDGLVTLGDADRDVDLLDRPVRWFSYWARRGASRGDSND